MTGAARTGATIVDPEHGSWLTCDRRLGCADPDHYTRRRAYNNAVKTTIRRRQGAQPARRGRTHGTRSTRRVCHDGPAGRACELCLEADRRYANAYRAAHRRAG